MRKATVNRETNETKIKVELAIEGSGTGTIKTPVGFLTHMLDLLLHHSGFDLSVDAVGDVEVDYHHTVEDIGICIGRCIKTAIGDKKGINRYGTFSDPMDEARARVLVDISGRPHYRYEGPELKGKTGDFDGELTHEFFKAVSLHAGITLHIIVESGDNLHHMIEASFKAFARALKKAVTIIPGNAVPSSKGVLD